MRTETGTELATSPQAPLTTPTPRRADEHPAAVYLARLAPSSRSTMRTAPDTIASILI